MKIKVCEHCNKPNKLEATYSADWCSRCKKFAYGKYVNKFLYKLKNMKIIKQIWHSKWFPRIFYIKPDGGKDSGVTAYFLIEWKILFSIGILHFKKGSREAYHNHAFNALTWWLKGSVTEAKLNASFDSKNNLREKNEDITKDFKPSLVPKYTSKDNFHKVIAHKDTYALTFRGAWKDTWQEFKNEKYITLTHERKEI